MGGKSLKCKYRPIESEKDASETCVYLCMALINNVKKKLILSSLRPGKASV
jgi:hypothetical protein